MKIIETKQKNMYMLRLFSKGGAIAKGNLLHPTRILFTFTENINKNTLK